MINQPNSRGETAFKKALSSSMHYDNLLSRVLNFLIYMGADVPTEEKILEMASTGAQDYEVRNALKLTGPDGNLRCPLSFESFSTLKKLYATKIVMQQFLGGLKLSYKFEDAMPQQQQELYASLLKGDVAKAQDLIGQDVKFNPYSGPFSIFDAARDPVKEGLVRSALSLKTLDGITLVNVNHNERGETLFDIYQKAGNKEMLSFLKSKGAKCDFEVPLATPEIEDEAHNVHHSKVKAAVSYSILKGRELFAQELANPREIFEKVKGLAVRIPEWSGKILERLKFLEYQDQRYDNIYGNFDYIPTLTVRGLEAVSIAYCFIKDAKIQELKGRDIELSEEVLEAEVFNSLKNTLFKNLYYAAIEGPQGKAICQQGTFNKVFDMPYVHKHCFVIPPKVTPHLLHRVEAAFLSVIEELPQALKQLVKTGHASANLLNDIAGQARAKLGEGDFVSLACLNEKLTQEFGEVTDIARHPEESYEIDLEGLETHVAGLDLAHHDYSS